MTSHRPAQIADPEEVGVREFREKVATYTEPVRVYHTRGQLKFLGTWYPAGTKPEVDHDLLDEQYELGRDIGRDDG